MADQFGNYSPDLQSAGKTIATYNGNGSPDGVITPTDDEAVYFDALDNSIWLWSGSTWNLQE